MSQEPKRHIPYGFHSIDEDDVFAVVETLRGGLLTQGPKLRSFEEALAEYCGVRYAVVVSSGTAALHVLLGSIGLGVGSKVWTTPNSFVATTNAALYLGAEVEFVDIDVTTGLISIDALSEQLLIAKRRGRLPDAVIVVNYAGNSVAMKKVSSLLRDYGEIFLIEDSAHALGATYEGIPVGSCRYSDASIFSFHPVKSITTGEGGAITCNTEEIARKAERLRDHGIERKGYPRDINGVSVLFDQVELGYHYRMNEICASLGLSQLKKLDENIKRREKIVLKYDDLIRNSAFRALGYDRKASSHHLYVIQSRDESRILNNSKTKNAFMDENISVSSHYRPIYKNSYYRQRQTREVTCPNAELFHRISLSLPVYQSLDDEDLYRIFKVLERISQ